MWSVKCLPKPGSARMSARRSGGTGDVFRSRSNRSVVAALVSVGVALMLGTVADRRSGQPGDQGLGDLARPAWRRGAFGQVGGDRALDRGGRIVVAQVLQ